MSRDESSFDVMSGRPPLVACREADVTCPAWRLQRPVARLQRPGRGYSAVWRGYSAVIVCQSVCLYRLLTQSVEHVQNRMPKSLESAEAIYADSVSFLEHLSLCCIVHAKLVVRLLPNSVFLAMLG